MKELQVVGSMMIFKYPHKTSKSFIFGLLKNRIMKYDLPIDYTKLHWTERRQVREQYIEEQEHKCYYCGCSLKEPTPKHITDKKINNSFLSATINDLSQNCKIYSGNFYLDSFNYFPITFGNQTFIEIYKRESNNSIKHFYTDKVRYRGSL